MYIYILYKYTNYRTIVRGVISCYIPTIPTTGGLNMPNFDFHLPSPTHRGLGTLNRPALKDQRIWRSSWRMSEALGDYHHFMTLIV